LFYIHNDELLGEGSFAKSWGRKVEKKKGATGRVLVDGALVYK